MKGNRLATMCGLLLAALLLAGAPAREPLRLGTNVWSGYEPLYLARDRGYLDPARVKLVEFRSATQVMHALETGAIDGGALTLDEVLTVTGRGVPLTLVMALDISAGADCIIVQPDLGGMADLRGRRIAVENTALGAYVLLRALEQAGLPVEEIEAVRMDVSRHVRSFESGEIAASVCFDPTRSKLLALGGKEVFTSNDIPGEIVDLIAIRNDALDRRRDALRHLGAAWDAALAYIADEPENAYSMLGRRMGLDRDGARSAYSRLNLLDLRASVRLLTSEAFRLETMVRVRRFMVDRGLIAHPVDPAIDAVLPETG